MYNEPLELLLDCWKRVFSLKTLGGGYIRYFLLFTPSGLVKVETSHVDSSPPQSGYVLHETFGRGDPASHLFWGAVFFVLEKVLEKKAEKEREAVRKARDIPTVGDFLDSLDEICSSLKIRKAEVKESIPYYHIEEVRVKRVGKTGFKLEIKHNRRKETYEAMLENEIEREKAVDKLNRLIGYSRFKLL